MYGRLVVGGRPVGLIVPELGDMEAQRYNDSNVRGGQAQFIEHRRRELRQPQSAWGETEDAPRPR
jgi:hypothetical protein